MPGLLDGLDWYERPTPYDVLGVTPDGGAAEIRDSYNGLLRNLQETGASSSDRAKEKERLDGAYNQLRVAGSRMRVDFFLIDPQLGQKQCEAIARTLAKPNTEVQGVIKPRQIKVTHAALLDELKTFNQEPPKVVGMHVKPMEITEPFALPEPLAIEFDC